VSLFSQCMIRPVLALSSVLSVHLVDAVPGVSLSVGLADFTTHHVCHHGDKGVGDKEQGLGWR